MKTEIFGNGPTGVNPPSTHSDSKSTWCGPTAHCCLHSSGFTFGCGPSLAAGVCLLKLKRGGSAGNSLSKLKRSDSASGGTAGGMGGGTAGGTGGGTAVGTEGGTAGGTGGGTAGGTEGGTLLPGGSRTRGTGRTLLRAGSAGAEASISDGKRVIKLVNSCRCGIAGREEATGH